MNPVLEIVTFRGKKYIVWDSLLFTHLVFHEDVCTQVTVDMQLRTAAHFLGAYYLVCGALLSLNSKRAQKMAHT